jgi:enterochelin esterase family protein
LDNLIAQNRIRPVALAMVAHGGKARGVEYLCSEATIGFLVERVFPLVKRELNLVDLATEPGAFGIMGVSFGGLMALYTGLRQPHIFGRVLSQSGGFGFEEHDFVVKDLVRFLPKRPIKIWMDVGIYDYFLSINQRMYNLLVERGYEVQYREFPGGHNYTSWRDDLWRGLEFLFPPS